MLDLKKELKAYKQMDPDAFVERGYAITDEVRNSMSLYNKALLNLNLENEDIAIIELKKAISINPYFNEAINLLGLCYAATGQYDRAEKMFNRVIQSEKNSVLAMDYLSKINSDLDKNGNASSTSKSGSAGKTGSSGKSGSAGKSEGSGRSRETGKPGGSGKSVDNMDADKDMRIAATGISNISRDQIRRKASFAMNENKKKYRNTSLKVTALIIFLILIISGSYILLSNAKVWFPDSSKKTQNKVSINSDTANDSDDGQDAEEVYMLKMEEFNEARELFSKRNENSGNLYKAADIAVSLKDFSFEEADKTSFDGFFTGVIVEASKTGYLEARSYYDTGNYIKAEELMKKVYYSYGYLEYPVWQTYFMGLCHYDAGNKVQAEAVFNQVVSRYPGSEYEGYSRNYLSLIQLSKTAQQSQTSQNTPAVSTPISTPEPTAIITPQTTKPSPSTTPSTTMQSTPTPLPTTQPSPSSSLP